MGHGQRHGGAGEGQQSLPPGQAAGNAERHEPEAGPGEEHEHRGPERAGDGQDESEADRLARQIKAHAPHCRFILTVNEMKRLSRDAAELTALADHLSAHGLVLEMLTGPLPGL